MPRPLYSHPPATDLGLCHRPACLFLYTAPRVTMKRQCPSAPVMCASFSPSPSQIAGGVLTYTLPLHTILAQHQMIFCRPPTAPITDCCSCTLLVQHIAALPALPLSVINLDPSRSIYSLPLLLRCL
ncbi:hypothetical protein ACK3TF_003676 [Chlorella vulgaris]